MKVGFINSSISKLFVTGVFFIITGVISWFIQNIYYGHVDEDGTINDSFFLPLAFIFIIIGTILLLTSIVSIIYKQFR